MIEVRDLRKSYGEFEAVRGVSFDAGPGGVVGILGPNGAGKTTILRILAGYHGPTSGTARVAGIDAAEDPRELKRRVGYLPENAPLYPELTAEEHLAFAAEARGLRGPAKARAIREAAERAGAAEARAVPAERLSKGWRQRVGLALALLGDPPVLVLDEPTAGLDPNQIRQTRQLIRDLGRDRTVLLSTHILGEAEALCSEILVLFRGALAGKGSPREISEGLASRDRLEAVIKAPGAPEVEAALARLAGAGLEGPPSPEGIGAWRVRLDFPAGAADPAESVSDWAASEGFKLLELKTERLSMEEAFARLTGEEGE